MTIARARLVVKEAINRIARLEPDEARDLERAIHVLIDEAVAREAPEPYGGAGLVTAADLALEKGSGG